MRNRLIASLAVFFVFLLVDVFALLLRMSQTEELSSLSGQYTSTIISFFPRGTIYDRKGIRLTNRPDQKFPYIDAPSNYSNIAKAVIGAVDEIGELDTTPSGAKGVSGIQKIYDSLLNGGSKITVKAPVDAKGKIFSTEGITVKDDHPNEGCTIETTLDYKLQKSFEAELEGFQKENGYKSIAAVLTKVSTGEILVMASCGSEMNTAVLTYQPGSLMKIVTVAAALETGVIDPDERYECTGSVIANNTLHYCSNHLAHGLVNMAEAFSKSCNSYFYEVAKKMEYESEDGYMTNHLLDLAKSWGFCEYGFPEPDFELSYKNHYSFVSSKIYNEETLFNAALGEGVTQASPYLFTKIVAAIANGGSITEPYIVSNIIDPAGTVIKTAEKKLFSLNIKPETIKAIQDMMIMACKTGTGSSNTVGIYGGLAGKTGTAQNSANKDHAWFTGYFPISNPDYAMTVFIEEGGSSKNALDLYCKLADIIYSVYPDGEE